MGIALAATVSRMPTVFLKFNVTSGERNYICQQLGP
jgi:hypothetical protein